MAPLAGMLGERGYRVTGSDAGVYPPASILLESLGIPFFSTFNAAHLTPAPDLIVVGNAISRGNSEVEEMLDRKLPHRSLPQILEEEFLPGKHSIVVSGTHGKTTTTAMLAWIFQVPGSTPIFLSVASQRILAKATAWREARNSSSKGTNTIPLTGIRLPNFCTTVRTT